jgi:hypothetical protein
MSEPPKQVWLHSLPGIIASITGLLGAITAFLALLYQQGILGDSGKSSEAENRLNIAAALNTSSATPDHDSQKLLVISCADIANTHFSILQENGPLVKVDILSQSGNVIKGLAHTDVSGKFSGVIAANSVQFTVVWDNGSTGFYSGRIGQDRQIDGQSYDITNPKSQAKFKGDFPCSGM